MAGALNSTCPPNAAVKMLVPMAHVVDVERSIAFYEKLGFKSYNILRGHDGVAFWASIKSVLATLMFARASGPIDPGQQAILFYLYTDDLIGLRNHLIASGLHDTGKFCGQAMGGAGEGAVSTITYPHYMPKGEFRVEDPDQYTLLIGQLS